MAKKNKNPFLKPLTPKRFRRESRAMANVRYRPELRSIKGEQRASKQRQRHIRKWFNQYGKSIDQAAQRTASAYQGAGQQIGQNSQAAANYAETLRQRLAQEGMADAQRRGASFDPSGSQLNAQAQLARINAANVLQGVTAAQGASQGAFMADKRRIAKRESITQRMREQDRRRALSQERRALQRDRGEYMASLRPQAREAERNYHLGLLAARDRKAARRFERREAAKDRAFRASEAAKDRSFDRRKERRDAKRDRSKKVDPGDVRRMVAILEGLNRRMTHRAGTNRRWAINQLLLKNKNYSPKEARRAYRKWRNKHVAGPFKN